MRGSTNTATGIDENVMGYQEEAPEVLDDEHYDIDGEHPQPSAFIHVECAG